MTPAGWVEAGSPVRPGAPGRGGVRFTDRVVIVGQTGRGKSVLARHLLAAMRPRKVLIDPKNELDGFPGATLARGAGGLLAALRAGEPVVRFVPVEGTPDEYHRAYAAILEQPEPVVTFTDELYAPGDANSAPRGLRLLLTQGRSLGKGHIGATQRPRRVCLEAISEAQHFYLFGPPPARSDLSLLADYVGQPEPVLRHELARLEPYAYLWSDRTTGELTSWPPLPRHLRA
jgi:energy-coupling factor transporter ATP-binding protein EcfA2